ncbi:MAG: ribonuclease J [Oscillospiraceae bacterium]|jgi:ribonuclease J|nr:ribonuclease J [Oscillospiraceae bacterium]
MEKPKNSHESESVNPSNNAAVVKRIQTRRYYVRKNVKQNKDINDNLSSDKVAESIGYIEASTRSNENNTPTSNINSLSGFQETKNRPTQIKNQILVRSSPGPLGLATSTGRIIGKPRISNKNFASFRNAFAAKLPPIKIIFLGGLNQIGKNMTAFEFEQNIIIVDCGMAFPDGEMLGVDLVIPDFTYLEQNKEKIKGLVVTHGHEDHIGSIPYLLKKINIPIYSAPLTIGLISAKLKEHRMLGNAKLNSVKAGEIIKLGCFDVEFVHINHSIPDAVALAIHTPLGTIIHTGDFKIDFTPARGEMINLARFAELGKEGVLALLADSTNADRPGYTSTEKGINESFEHLFERAEKRRIIVATFASNIGRIQQIVDCAVRHGRKVMFSGRSMINYVSISCELGYICAPKDVIVNIDELGKYPANEIVLITTGSQGEPMSALYRMAFSEHKKVEAGPNDFVIISANPIPGNEKMVGTVVNGMMKLGCEVIYESMYEIHVSGHACQEELKTMQGLTKPKFFIPIHGECKHLKAHAAISRSMGLESSKIFVGETGDVIEITENQMKKTSTVPSEMIMVDGIGVGDVGSVVLRDRKHLGQDGLIVMVTALNIKEKKIVAGPDVVSRGFVYVKESEGLMHEARKTASHAILSCFEQEIFDWAIIKTKIRDDLCKLFHDRTRRNPVILPIVMEIRK